ncbi:MAG: recombinase family protein [Methanomassiliicoccales archaeon]
MVRAALYIRVSTEDQAKEGFSLEAQKEKLIAYCESQGWEIAACYEDNGYSGRNTKRPAYQRMMQERDFWDVILVMKMDRIHRNSKNFMTMMENLEKWGKKFASMNESLDTSTAVGRFVVDIIQRIAQLESEQIGERTYMGMIQKAESSGGPMGSYPPYGYCFKSGKIVAHDTEAPVVLEIFQSYYSGIPMDDIAWRLNQKGILTKRGCRWTVWSISRILHNPIYAGYLFWDGKVLATDHEPIVSKELFESVQKKIRFRLDAKIKIKKHMF